MRHGNAENSSHRTKLQRLGLASIGPQWPVDFAVKVGSEMPRSRGRESQANPCGKPTQWGSRIQATGRRACSEVLLAAVLKEAKETNFGFELGRETV